MNIPVAEAKNIRERLGATHLIIFAVDEQGDCVATHGQTEANAKECAKFGNKLKKAIGWPDDLCKSVAVERKCGNCAYFQAERGTFYMNTGYDERVYGHCMVLPKPIGRAGMDRACHLFEPKS